MTPETFLDQKGTAALWEKVKALLAPGGSFAFSINEDGHLILHYAGAVPPDFYIGEDGHLYLNLN